MQRYEVVKLVSSDWAVEIVDFRCGMKLRNVIVEDGVVKGKSSQNY